MCIVYLLRNTCFESHKRSNDCLTSEELVVCQNSSLFPLKRTVGEVDTQGCKAHTGLLAQVMSKVFSGDGHSHHAEIGDVQYIIQCNGVLIYAYIIIAYRSVKNVNNLLTAYDSNLRNIYYIRKLTFKTFAQFVSVASC